MENIGLQLYSIREAAEKNLLKMIREVAEMGYKGAQFAGFFDHHAEDVKKTMDEVGLSAAGAHVQLDQLQHHLDDTLKYHETIGNRSIIVPMLPKSMRTTEDDYKRTASILDNIGKKLHSEGFILGYHNHDFEFDLFDGKTGFDIIYENTDTNHLKMELDCYWAAYTGNDPLNIIEKYADRCLSLHIKDMKETGEQNESTELGTGTLPLHDYIKTGINAKAKWFVVEQEHFTKDPVESAKQNAKTIKKLVEQL